MKIKLEFISSITVFLNKILPFIISIFILIGFLFIGISVDSLFERDIEYCIKSTVVITSNDKSKVEITELSNNSLGCSRKVFLLISLGVGFLIIARYLETIRRIE